MVCAWPRVPSVAVEPQPQTRSLSVSSWNSPRASSLVDVERAADWRLVRLNRP